MRESAALNWLADKWMLPEAAYEPVRRLMHAESGGSTACALEDEMPDWGNAAAAAGEDSPLVIVRHEGKTYLQSRRLFETERDIAVRIRALAGLPPSSEDFSSQLEKLFPDAVPGDLQVEAARTAATRHLSLITGGPGTGKTYVLARILALLAGPEMPAGSIRLAAPTGKAADRMKKAVAESLEGLPESFQKNVDLLVRIANSSSTIHTLLGYNPNTGRCRFGKDNPLPCRALILDECSMVDVHLWRALLQALPADSRLVLLGDPNQLQSVGQGNVFFDMACTAAISGSSLHSAHVHLTEARRFKDSPGIVALARALENSNPEAAAELLGKSRGKEPREGIAWIESTGGALPCTSFPPSVLGALESVATANSPQAALSALNRVCILTAQREFFVGSKAMSIEVEKYFSLRKDACNHPVIINRNDPETGLRNGAVGVICRTADNERKAFFPTGDGTLSGFSLSQLPDHNPAWAITIHRSQGSEYDDVLVILPRMESPMATRELLYTAITRARKNVYIAGDMETVKKAVVTSSARCTMLASFLHA